MFLSDYWLDLKTLRLPLGSASVDSGMDIKIFSLMRFIELLTKASLLAYIFVKVKYSQSVCHKTKFELRWLIKVMKTSARINTRNLQTYQQVTCPAWTAGSPDKDTGDNFSWYVFAPFFIKQITIRWEWQFRWMIRWQMNVKTLIIIMQW